LIMEDRELLELAAKAVGHGVLVDISGRICGSFNKSAGSANNFGDPLGDDGDALRLAVKLDIHIKRFSGSTSAEEWTTSNRVEEHDHWSVNGGDPMAATRRAIVRAAAEIGRGMP
jgi:hypothetical protein